MTGINPRSLPPAFLSGTAFHLSAFRAPPPALDPDPKTARDLDALMTLTDPAHRQDRVPLFSDHAEIAPSVWDPSLWAYDSAERFFGVDPMPPIPTPALVLHTAMSDAIADFADRIAHFLRDTDETATIISARVDIIRYRARLADATDMEVFPALYGPERNKVGPDLANDLANARTALGTEGLALSGTGDKSRGSVLLLTHPRALASAPRPERIIYIDWDGARTGRYYDNLTFKWHDL